MKKNVNVMMSIELKKEGLKRKKVYKVLEKEYSDNKYFVKIEEQPNIKGVVNEN